MAITDMKASLKTARALQAREKRADEKLLRVFGAETEFKEIMRISDQWSALGKEMRANLLMRFCPFLGLPSCIVLESLPLSIIVNVLPPKTGRRIVGALRK